MTVESCSGGSCKDISLGYFGTPETHLKLGNNHANWDVGAKLLDSSSLLNEFILPMFLENKTVSLVLGSDDVSMLLRFTVLPLPFSKLKLEKKLDCSMLATTNVHPIPDKFCHPSGSTEERDESQGYSIKCVPHTTTIVV